MTSLTDVWDLVRHDDVDPLSDIGANLRAALDRIDYLLGEHGTHTFAAATGTRTTQINLSRPYPTGFRVLVGFGSPTAAGTGSCWYESASSGGGPGGVGEFELGCNTSISASRTVVWRVMPL